MAERRLAGGAHIKGREVMQDQLMVTSDSTNKSLGRGLLATSKKFARSSACHASSERIHGRHKRHIIDIIQRIYKTEKGFHVTITINTMISIMVSF